ISYFRLFVVCLLRSQRFPTSTLFPYTTLFRSLKYGYTSPTSFNRAFQSVHSITPAAARKMGSILNAYPALRFSVQVTGGNAMTRSEEHTSELQSRFDLVCRLLLEKKKTNSRTL